MKRIFTLASLVLIIILTASALIDVITYFIDIDTTFEWINDNYFQAIWNGIYDFFIALVWPTLLMAARYVILDNL